jgi:hypothetical protein
MADQIETSKIEDRQTLKRPYADTPIRFSPRRHVSAYADTFSLQSRRLSLVARQLHIPDPIDRFPVAPALDSDAPLPIDYTHV